MQRPFGVVLEFDEESLSGCQDTSENLISVSLKDGPGLKTVHQGVPNM